MSRSLSDKEQYWLEHLLAAQRLGLSLYRYAKQQGLTVSSLYRWKHRLNDEGLLDEAPCEASVRTHSKTDEAIQEQSVLVPIVFNTRMAGSSSPMECRIHLRNGRVIDWPLSADVASLGGVVGVLEPYP